MSTDEVLWRRALEGNAEAFAMVFDRHANAVYNHCLRRCHTWSDAEDVTSLVFLEAWRQASKIRFVDASARPWLLLVATNLARNNSRARNRYARALARLPAAQIEPDFADETVRSVDAERQRSAVADAIATLRRAEQEVIALCDLEELTYEEAARVLDIPLGTVRSRLSRARSKLRRALLDAGIVSSAGTEADSVSTPVGQDGSDV